MKLIPLTQGKFAKVDDEDFDKFGKIKWCAKKFGNTFAATRRKSIYLHREIMGNPNGMFIDHINHDGLDNRKENLRVCTLKQNCQNKRGSAGPHSITGIRWVSPYGNRFRVQGVRNGKNAHLGIYNTIKEAESAAILARTREFGEYAGK